MTRKREETLQGSLSAAFMELVHAIQRARSRLAVAVATENKATPLDRWRYYRETDELMRRCVKGLLQERNECRELDHAWLGALEALRGLPNAPSHEVSRHGEAHQLCVLLRRALEPLAQTHAAKAASSS